MNSYVLKSLLEARETTKHDKFTLGEDTGYNWPSGPRTSHQCHSGASNNVHLVGRIIWSPKW